MPADTDSLLCLYTLRLADDAAILSQQLGEWGGRAPGLEENIVLTNIALDLLGQARALYGYAAELEGEGRDVDDLVSLRDERQFVNVLLVEQINGDFAHTVVRQFLFSAVQHPFWRAMTGSVDPLLASLAAKAEKELAYHLRHCGEWLSQLGDGTQESHARAESALDLLWPYSGELLETDAVTRALIERGAAVDPQRLRAEIDATVNDVLARARLKRPDNVGMRTGGRDGLHSAHLAHVLARMRRMHRTEPGLSW